MVEVVRQYKENSSTFNYNQAKGKFSAIDKVFLGLGRILRKWKRGQ